MQEVWNKWDLDGGWKGGLWEAKMERFFCRKVHNSKWAQISDGVNNKKYHLLSQQCWKAQLENMWCDREQQEWNNCAPTVLTKKLSPPISIYANPWIQSTNLSTPQLLQVLHFTLLCIILLLFLPILVPSSTVSPVTGSSPPSHETFQARPIPQPLRKPSILNLEAVIDPQRIAILGRDGSGDERERGKELHVFVAEGGCEEITDNDDLALEKSFEMEIFRWHQWRESRPRG